MDSKNATKSHQAFEELRARAMQVTEALYRTTDLFSDSEPLKWSLRDSAVKILNTISDINTQPTYQELRNVQMLEKMIEALCYKLDLAVGGTFVARSNFDVLEREYKSLSEKIGHTDFFETPFLLAQGIKNHRPRAEEPILMDTSDKRTSGVQKSPIGSSMSDTKQSIPVEIFSEAKISGQAMPMSVAQKQIDSTPFSSTFFKQKTSQQQDVLSDRKETILKLIKERGPSSVGDMRKLIDMSLSEKTIQRDLNALAESGILRRDGEKRWRRYFI